MAEVFGVDIGLNAPATVNLLAGGILGYILIFLVVMFTAGLLVFYIYNKRIYNRKLIVFENISGQGYQPTYKDTARLIKLGDGGEEILYLKKKKVYRTAYGKKMGKNTYWFAVGQDGYWYNCTLGDLDAKMGMLDIEPIDRDMRYMHVAIRKNITERYRKIGFMERYGTVVIGAIFLFIMFGGLWFLIDQIGELMNQATAVVKASQQINEPLQNAISHLDSICSGGRGIS